MHRGRIERPMGWLVGWGNGGWVGGLSLEWSVSSDKSGIDVRF